MLAMKKAQALAETILWIIAVIMIMCIGLPIGMLLSLAGIAFKLIHIDAVSKMGGRFMNMIIAFVKFVTRRIRIRTKEIEAARAACSTAN